MRHLNLDDPQLTARRRQVLRKKKFLRQIYTDWYRLIASRIGDMPGARLELGSGAGFIEEQVGGIITSDILLVPHIYLALDSMVLPFKDTSLSAMVMVDVLHHIPRVEAFFQEAQRALVSGGRIVMVEPWITRWSKWVFKHLHHEPANTDAKTWQFETSGPLSGANQALPWIVFERDQALFEKKFPALKILEIQPMMPARYLLSGGLARRFGAPSILYPLVVRLERIFARWLDHTAMFALIVLQKD